MTTPPKMFGRSPAGRHAPLPVDLSPATPRQKVLMALAGTALPRSSELASAQPVQALQGRSESAPRHRTPRSLSPIRVLTASALATAGMTAAGSMLAGASASTPVPSPSALHALAQCESGGNYMTDTGNGYYGAYQFSLSTWQSLGLGGLPSQASPAVQDQATQQLWQRDGWAPWPTCSVELGLNSYSLAVQQAPTPAPAPSPAATTKLVSLPSYAVEPGDTLSAIALRYGTTWSALATTNRLADPNLILIGQVLQV